MRINHFLGYSASDLLASLPFSSWKVTKRYVPELRERHYLFSGKGVSVRCDESNTVRGIFLTRDSMAALPEDLVEVSFGFERDQVISVLGIPSFSRETVDVPILGRVGAGDNFARKGYEVQISYLPDSGLIERVAYVLE